MLGTKFSFYIKIWKIIQTFSAFHIRTRTAVFASSGLREVLSSKMFVRGLRSLRFRNFDFLFTHPPYHAYLPPSIHLFIKNISLNLVAFHDIVHKVHHPTGPNYGNFMSSSVVKTYQSLYVKVKEKHTNAMSTWKIFWFTFFFFFDNTEIQNSEHWLRTTLPRNNCKNSDFDPW